MEDGFILLLRCSHLWEQRVLILVVVDDGLVLTNARAYDYCKAVLILVVVDDGLVPHKDLLMCVLSQSLNPCCSGRWSRTVTSTMLSSSIWSGLNPCCSGRWSRTEAKKIKKEHKLAVLILVVVEDGLVPFTL